MTFKETNMGATATVIRNGNSAAVIIPSSWRKRYGVDIGDKLELNDAIPGKLVLSKPTTNNRLEAVDELTDFIDGLPAIPWAHGDSPEDDKELIGERYA